MVDMHPFDREGVGDDVLGQAIQVLALVRLHAPAVVDVEPGMHPAAQNGRPLQRKQTFWTRNVMIGARKSCSRGWRLASGRT